MDHVRCSRLFSQATLTRARGAAREAVTAISSADKSSGAGPASGTTGATRKGSGPGSRLPQ